VVGLGISEPSTATQALGGYINPPVKLSELSFIMGWATILDNPPVFHQERLATWKPNRPNFHFPSVSGKGRITASVYIPCIYEKR